MAAGKENDRTKEGVTGKEGASEVRAVLQRLTEVQAPVTVFETLP